MTRVAVVTAWWNGHDLLDGYVAAMNASSVDLVVAVDNGSDPKLRHQPGWSGHRWPLLHIPCDRNYGFSYPNNVGFRAARSWGADAVVFLNNDVVRDGPGDWLAGIRAALRRRQLVGAQLRADAHTRVDGLLRPYLDGWCLAGMVADLSRLGALGPWDEGFAEPAYFGDNDLCARAVAAGLELHQATVGLRHLGNMTSRRLDVAAVSARNRERFIDRVRELDRARVAA